MIRVYRGLYKYALDKESMMRRRKCFYGADPTLKYEEDTIKYVYNLALHSGNMYEGVANISFKLKERNDTFLDFTGKTVQKMIVNSKQISNPSSYFNQGKINLPSSLLKQNQNEVCIKYESQYDKDGSGCVSFIDVDKKQYLYTQFQPYMGNRVFPMFDQPDLKAKMELSIACPSEWEAVLSNEDQAPQNGNKFRSSPVCQVSQKVLNEFQHKLPNNYKVTNFLSTKLLPTYLFCFVVGPYKKYVNKNTYKNIPMNLYSIESLYPYMMKLVPFIQQMTNQSMEFFEKYFGYPYPFSKYDQVFAHEYKWGAMENAGIVTLNDLYLFKDPVSTEKMIGFGNTIVHQMAHHWFGNLVTMKWWDDLWLNESFAEYISHFCLEKIKKNVTTLNYQSAMSSFLNRKAWGYAEDQLETTHPIRSDVANTKVAQSIFDGITYSKGAATMKQLMYLMGQQAFSKALAQYFGNFQFKNAQLEDLLKYMTKHYGNKSGVSIDAWREMWLEKAGLNILSCEFDEGKKVLRVKQSAYHKNHPTLRSHTIKIAIIQNPKTISQIQIVVKPTEVTEIELTSQQLQKLKISKALLLNHEDLTFAKVIIDEKSIKYFKQHLNQIDNILFRSLVWKNFYDMVKDGNLKSTQYAQILANNLFQQKSDALLQQNLNNVSLAIHKYTPQIHRSKCLDLLFDKCLQQTQGLKQNRGIIIRDKLIQFCFTNNLKNIQILQGWYYEKNKQFVEKFGVSNITEKWKIVLKILSSRLVDKKVKKDLLEDMIKRDNSDTMKNRKLVCDGLLLEQHQVQAYLNKYIQDVTQKISMTNLVHILSGINAKIHEKSIRSNLNQKYFNIIRTALTTKEHPFEILKKDEMLEIFVDHMDPNIEETLQDLQTKVKQFKQVKVQNNDKIRIQILKKIDLLRKRIKCFQLYQ